jgi:hypothetical protein
LEDYHLGLRRPRRLIVRIVGEEWIAPEEAAGEKPVAKTSLTGRAKGDSGAGTRVAYGRSAEMSEGNPRAHSSLAICSYGTDHCGYGDKRDAESLLHGDSIAALASGELKINTAVIILLASRVQVQVGQFDLPRAAWG